MATAIVIIDNYDGNLYPGDDIQIHKWFDPNTEARMPVADGIINNVVVIEGDHGETKDNNA